MNSTGKRAITLDRLIKRLRRHAVEFGQVGIDHHLLAADHQNAGSNFLYR